MQEALQGGGGPGGGERPHLGDARRGEPHFCLDVSRVDIPAAQRLPAFSSCFWLVHKRAELGCRPPPLGVSGARAWLSW